MHQHVVGHGDKNLPFSCLRSIKDHGKTDAASRSGTFHTGFPCGIQVTGAVWMTKAPVLQTEHSPALLSSVCSQIVSTQVTKHDSGAGCDLYAGNVAYVIG